MSRSRPVVGGDAGTRCKPSQFTDSSSIAARREMRCAFRTRADCRLSGARKSRQDCGATREALSEGEADDVVTGRAAPVEREAPEPGLRRLNR